MLATTDSIRDYLQEVPHLPETGDLELPFGTGAFDADPAALELCHPISYQLALEPKYRDLVFINRRYSQHQCSPLTPTGNLRASPTLLLSGTGVPDLVSTLSKSNKGPVSGTDLLRTRHRAFENIERSSEKQDNPEQATLL